MFTGRQARAFAMPLLNCNWEENGAGRFPLPLPPLQLVEPGMYYNAEAHFIAICRVNEGDLKLVSSKQVPFGPFGHKDLDSHCQNSLLTYIFILSAS